jgi:hypothetical protein
MERVVMTHSCCPSCRLRFTRAAAASLEACPRCGERPISVDNAEQIIGFRLVAAPDLVEPVALAVAMPIPGLPGDLDGR